MIPRQARSCRVFITLAIIFAASLPASAQFGSAKGPDGRLTPTIRLKSPQPYQVFQRDSSGKADIPVLLPDDMDDHEIVGAYLIGPGGMTPFRDGKFRNVQTGGPYSINLTIKAKPKAPAPADDPKNKDKDQPKTPSPNRQFRGGMMGGQMGGMMAGQMGGAPGEQISQISLNSPFFVGDLWVLAGQSNMEGYGNLEDLTPPSDRVSSLGMNGQWEQAQDPLHWLIDSPDPVHSGDPKDRAKRSAEAHKSRSKGAGLGLPFAAVLAGWTNVPIGLIPCAHGGTSMLQWDPAKKSEGGKSLYGSMIRQIQLAGGKVKGVLWYQGESDAAPEAAPLFAKKFAAFIASVRADLGNSELPFYYVQIGRHVTQEPVKGWNVVQEAQRKGAEDIPNTAVISVIDLELDDGIHIGTLGLKRAGVRLARIAARELFDQAGASTPTLDRITRGNQNTLVLRFKGVNRVIPGNPNNRILMAGEFADIPALTNLSSALSSHSAVYGSSGRGNFPNDGSNGPLGGLQPARHIGGFSIRKADGTEIPMIFEAEVGTNRETVVLRLTGEIPPGSNLWYGYGRAPYCNLTDVLDMAVPVFGPIPLDGLK